VQPEVDGALYAHPFLQVVELSPADETERYFPVVKEFAKDAPFRFLEENFFGFVAQPHERAIKVKKNNDALRPANSLIYVRPDIEKVLRLIPVPGLMIPAGSPRRIRGLGFS
jgi:hypothetical protein